MSSFMLDTKFYQRMYKESVKAIHSESIWIYPINRSKEEANKIIYELFRELQRANAETIYNRYDELLDDEIIKFETLNFEKYHRVDVEMLTRLYKNIQCILYQIETEIDPKQKNILTKLTLAIADKIIETNLYYEDAEWGGF